MTLRHFPLFAVCSLACAGVSAQAEKHDMELAGVHDLQGRSAYQPVVHRQGDRWIAYIGHHGGRTLNPLTAREEANGTSIVEVTDPKQPRYLAHVPGEPGEGATNAVTTTLPDEASRGDERRCCAGVHAL